jgi:hypothetical protein
MCQLYNAKLHVRFSPHLLMCAWWQMWRWPNGDGHWNEEEEQIILQVLGGGRLQTSSLPATYSQSSRVLFRRSMFIAITRSVVSFGP